RAGAGGSRGRSESRRRPPSLRTSLHGAPDDDGRIRRKRPNLLERHGPRAGAELPPEGELREALVGSDAAEVLTTNVRSPDHRIVSFSGSSSRASNATMRPRLSARRWSKQ